MPTEITVPSFLTIESSTESLVSVARPTGYPVEDHHSLISPKELLLRNTRTLRKNQTVTFISCQHTILSLSIEVLHKKGFFNVAIARPHPAKEVIREHLESTEYSLSII